MSRQTTAEPASRPGTRRIPIGAEPQDGGGVHFRVWAPAPTTISLALDRDGAIDDIPLKAEADGYFGAFVEDAGPGTRYWYRLDGELLPDPASRYQPDGPFGSSMVVDSRHHAWKSDAPSVSMRGQVLYELHIGTFTPERTWRSAAERLPLLARTGITVVEVMPVAEFPGRFGWGYDGVFPFAPTRLYGTPDDFRGFIDRAHELGLAVILDVVYNHFGPDGAVFGRYASEYFARHYSNEWGDALNFDGPGSAAVREFFSSNAAYWIDEYRLDGLRLDATQTIHDASEEHVLAVIARRARAAAGNRRILLIAENERQDVRLARTPEDGGYGLDGLWNDDFHHSALVAMTGRREAYYTDHRGTPQELVSAAKYGYLFQGQRYAWQKQARGTPTRGIAPEAFVNFIENHDQVANSADGSRVWLRTTPGRYRAMTALFILMPGTPMLFQGQEFGASAPFLFFADHHPELAAAVQKGRGEFLCQFPSVSSPEMQRALAVPHDPRTFERATLDWREYDEHVEQRRLHEDLLALRRTDAVFASEGQVAVDGAVLAPEAFVLRYASKRPEDERLFWVNLGPDLVEPAFAEPLIAPPEGFAWRVRWSSEDPQYGGGGTPDVVSDEGWRIPGHAAVWLEPKPAQSSGTGHKA